MPGTARLDFWWTFLLLVCSQLADFVMTRWRVAFVEMVPILLLSENTVQSITSEVSPDMVLEVFGSNRLLYCSTRATDWCRSTLMQNTHLAVLHHQSVTLSPIRGSRDDWQAPVRYCYSDAFSDIRNISNSVLQQKYSTITTCHQGQGLYLREEFVLTPVLSWAQYEPKGFFCLFLTVKI